VIPDEAVEAAQGKFMEVLADLRLKEGGGFKAASQQRRAIAAALEAAAPHLMARVWDEGANVAWAASGEGYNGEYPDPGEPFDAEPNPYRERKMTPEEIEEWRKTCPYPEALGQ
jgi:hypothetical protein